MSILPTFQSQWDTCMSRPSQILVVLMLTTCLHRCLAVIVFREIASQLDPTTDSYGVHPHPVYFQDQPMQDTTYFNNSTVRLECDTTCKQDCDIRIRYNQSSYLVHGNLYKIPMRFEILNSAGKQTLEITNANINSSGSYQCVMKVWRGYIVGKEIHLKMTAPGPTLQEIKLLSMGDSVFLPCYVNTPNSIYPVPDHVEWWRDGTLCSSLLCEDDILINNDGILLTNVTTNMSLQCVVYWTNPLHHHIASHYQLIINQQDTNNSCHVKVYPEISTVLIGNSVYFVCVASGCGINYNISWSNGSSSLNQFSVHNHTLHIPTVQLSDSGKYHCIVIRSELWMAQYNASGILQVTEPPHITNITSDVLIDINNTSTINDIILKCVFTGNPTPSAYWRMERRNELINLTHNTTIIGNTVILTLTITDNLVCYFGSYQCIAVSEAGYISRTTRILPKGWTNSPKNVRIKFDNNDLGGFSVNVTWDPPDYDGGVPIQQYKLTLYDVNNKINVILEDSLNTEFYLWNNFSQHFNTDNFEIQISVLVCGEYKEERSPAAKTIVTHLELHKQLTASRLKINLTVNCKGVDVIASWRVMNVQRVDDIDGYCVQYQCDTQEYHSQTCELGSSINYTNITGVLTNTTCWFMVTVKSTTEIDSNNVSCYRYPPPDNGTRLNLTVNLTINCEENITVANWELDNRESSDEIDGYYLQYWCNTTVTAEKHQMYHLDNVTNHKSMTGIPTNTTCWFMVTVKSTTEIDSNNVSCYRYSPPDNGTRLNLTVNLTINCEENITVANWELDNRESSDEIDGYYLQYWCNTTVTAEKHQMYHLDNVTNHKSMTGIPTNTTCWFMVTVKSTTEIDSNNVSCYRWSKFDDKPYDDKLWVIIWLPVLLLCVLSLGALGILLYVYNRRIKERDDIVCETTKEVMITTYIDDITIDTVSITEQIENNNDCGTVTNYDPEKDPIEMLEEITYTGKDFCHTISLCSTTDSMFSVNSSEEYNDECIPPYYGSTGVGDSHAQSSCQCADSGNSIVDNDDRSEGYSVSSHSSVI